ncbi:hypothetical protein H4218_004096 [Coemansia sp. IMI 209128]|nr:hypothetical protein H4218_004096 [Coemansia sp. IMI 209128]
MTRSKFSFLAAAWLLAAYQVEAGPIATAADNAATSSELASLGGLLQALGAGVIGNGALIYPTAVSSHQRAEAEILASDTATRVLKKVRSILKDGGLNEDEDGGDESSKSVTYLVKPALIFHKEELPPPNPLVGNVLPLPGGALLYTPTPTAGANGEATSGPAASIKAAYGNLFAAAPYTPSYTLNKPHAAVIVEEVTDLISLKSMQQRLEDAGEDESDDEEEDEYGRKKKGKKSVKFISLETIDSSTTFMNPFTRADFPFGLMTPTPTPTTKSEEPKTTTRKTIKKMLSAKSSQASDQISASLGKDGGITIIANSMPQTSVVPGTTIVIPQASLTSGPNTASSVSNASSASSISNASSASSSASPAATSVSIHEDSSRSDEVKANDVARLARTSSAKPDLGDSTSVKGNRRDAATAYDPLASSVGVSSMSGITDIAQATNMREAMELPSVTVGSSSEMHVESTATHASEIPKHRKMHVVRVFEVKKNKSAVASSSASAQSSSGDHVQKRDFMPLYDAPESTSMLETNPAIPLAAEPYSTELLAPNAYPVAPNAYPVAPIAYPAAPIAHPVVPNAYPIMPARMAPTVSNLQRMIQEPANDNDSESDSDDEQGSKKPDSDAEKISEALSMSKDNVSPTADASSSSAAAESTGTVSAESSSAESSSASAESSSASVESTGTASVESSSASINSSTASVESSSASVESTSAASAESSSVSGDVKVEASSTSASVESASASSSVQSTKATAQSTSSASAQTSSATAHSTSSVSAKKSGATTTANTTSRSLSIENVGAQETSVERGSASEEAESDKKADSDSDSDSDNESESGVERTKEGRDASEEGDSESSDNESELARNEDSDDDEDSPRTKADSRERLAIVPSNIAEGGDSLMAIQRVAALGLREAEKAVEEFERHSDAPGIEFLTTQDEKPMSTSSAAAPESTSELAVAQSIAQASASRSVVSALSAAMSSLGQHESPVRAAADKDRDDESDNDKDDDDEKRAKDDSDSDSDKGKSANSDDDSDEDSDDDKASKRGSKKSSRGESDKEANAARKAVSDAAKESAQQVVKATATELEAMATNSASFESADEEKAGRNALSEAASESAKQAVKATATELDDFAASDSMGIMTNAADVIGRLNSGHVSDDEMEFETNMSVNSDGEEIQFVTQLVPAESEDFAERARANESPSIVVMASIDEEYEEDYFTSPHVTGAKRVASNDIMPTRVQRNVVGAMNNVDDVYEEGDKVVRGVEPTPDLGIIKDSQNRAINIGLGNLRRHV